MTFKPLDFQMSVPRTQEFGGMHQQSLQRPITEQTMLASGTAKQTEEMRRQNTAIEKSSNLDVKTDQDSPDGNPYKKRKPKKKDDNAEQEPQPDTPAHPFKGHHFDIKL
ncbi:hypothetical protein [Paenibacillus sp. PL2-23]|uniref:hypothetical protein n=1 Tax=Paenibacillus sp. PL2-23 TaxID=2100729 RepID=UPI0030FA870C